MTNTNARVDIGRPVIVVPGLGGSDEDHWQTWLERNLSNTSRLSGVDWDRPDLSFWLERLLAAVNEQPHGIMVAHSLGCALLAHAVTLHPDLRVSGALLVAPADVDASPVIPETVGGFAGVPRVRLPFPSILIASANDLYMSTQRAELFASAWGARLLNLGACGHINVASGFGPWPKGLQILREFAHSLDSQTPIPKPSFHVNETERT